MSPALTRKPSSLAEHDGHASLVSCPRNTLLSAATVAEGVVESQQMLCCLQT